MSGVTAKVTATAMAIKPSTCAQAIDVRFAQIAMDKDLRCAPPFVTCAAMRVATAAKVGFGCL